MYQLCALHLQLSFDSLARHGGGFGGKSSALPALQVHNYYYMYYKHPLAHNHVA